VTRPELVAVPNRRSSDISHTSRSHTSFHFLAQHREGPLQVALHRPHRHFERPRDFLGHPFLPGTAGSSQARLFGQRGDQRLQSAIEQRIAGVRGHRRLANVPRAQPRGAIFCLHTPIDAAITRGRRSQRLRARRFRAFQVAIELQERSRAVGGRALRRSAARSPIAGADRLAARKAALVMILRFRKK